MEQSYLQFLRFGMGVVLGTLLLRASETMLEEHVFWTSPRLLLQLVAIMIFLELWLIITTYHEELKIEYHGAVLFVDLLLLSLPFMFFAMEVGRKSGVEHLPHALAVLACILILLFLRQAVPFWKATTGREKLQEELNKSRKTFKELQEQLRTSENDSEQLPEQLKTTENDIAKWQEKIQALSKINEPWLRGHLKTSMVADWLGVGLCIATAKAASNTDQTFYLSLLIWTWIGFASVSIYMLVFRFLKYLFTLQSPIKKVVGPS